MGYRDMGMISTVFLLALCAWAGAVSAETGAMRAELDSAYVDLIGGDYYGAIGRYKAVIAADSTVAEAYRYLGWLEIVTRQGDPRDAGDTLERAVALGPDDAGAHNDLGYVYAALLTYKPALNAFGKAAQLQPDEPLFHRNLGMVAAEARDYATAEMAFRRVVELDPLDDMGFYGLGQALARLGREDEALATYRQALRVNADQKESHLGIGQILARRRQFREAASAYERALTVDFYDPKPHYGLASLYRQMGDTTRATQEMMKYRQLEEKFRYVRRDEYIFPTMLDRVAAFRVRGLTYARLGRYEEALAQYREGLALADSPGSPYRVSPELPALRLAMGRAHQALGEVAEARRLYRDVRADAAGMPEGDRAQEGLADLHLFVEGIPEAEADGYERAVGMDPVSAAAFWIYDRLSRIHQEAGRLDRCIADYEAMRDLAPGSAGLRMRLGVAYAAAGRMEKAAFEYREAIRLTRGAPDLYGQLATLYRRAGRMAEAEAVEGEGKAP